MVVIIWKNGTHFGFERYVKHIFLSDPYFSTHCLQLQELVVFSPLFFLPSCPMYNIDLEDSKSAEETWLIPMIMLLYVTQDEKDYMCTVQGEQLAF